jgi:hypothetical protein
MRHTPLGDTDNSSEDSGKSDQILEHLSENLFELGSRTEDKSSKKSRISRPDLFGEQGSLTISYEVDEYQPDQKIVLENEVDRAWMGNAVLS